MTIKAIKDSSDDRNELLIEAILRQQDVVVSLLNNYDHFNDTHGEVFDFEIVDESLDINSEGQGRFRVSFVVYYYFGCDDLNKEYDQKMDFQIVLNFSRAEAEIIGELWKEREPDEF